MHILFILTLCTAHRTIALADPQQADQVTLSVRVSEQAQHQSTITLSDAGLVREIMTEATREPIRLVPISDAYITLRLANRTHSYLIDDFGYVIDIAASTRILLSEQRRFYLLQQVRQLREKHYGILASWDTMNKRLPRKEIFDVLDLETGLMFRVQRRAGSSHADVQPLTKRDTRIMKQIYNGRWSWKRRAILVGKPEDLLRGQAYAASMHGMPHGGDGILDNDFSGHFCIHYLDSRTHGSNKVDFDHHLMVLKAAGQLARFFHHATPGELVRSFFSGFNQQDAWLIYWCFASLNHPQVAFFEQQLPRISSVRIDLDDGAGSDLTEELTIELLVEADVYMEGHGLDKQTYTFHLIRDSYTSPWKIDHVALVS
jgi:hypothetical protein